MPGYGLSDIQSMSDEAAREVPWSSCRLYIKALVAIGKDEGSCAFQRQSDDWMEGRRDQRVVIDVEDPARRIVPTPSKEVSLNHPVAQRVVTQWLNLQPAVAQPTRKIAAAMYFVRVNIETAEHEDVAKAKVIRSHRWMWTPSERFREGTAEGTTNASL